MRQETVARLEDAIADAEEKLSQHPERRLDTCHRAVERGEPRPWPVFRLGRGSDPEAGETMGAKGPPPQLAPEERVLDKVRALTAPLGMHNPIRPALGRVGKGTGTLAASFGIPLDPVLDFSPVGYRPLDEVLAEGMPDPEHSGCIPEMRETIDAARALTPGWMKIQLPDMQGPFNIVHMVLGDEAFLAPMTEPAKFHALMTMVTDFFLALYENLRAWIGEDRLAPFTFDRYRLAECSVNMVSEAFYIDHILEHDRRIAEHYGEVGIHPCSGPHVFRVTLKNLPNVVYHEAGYIAQTAAGAISVDEALELIGARPVILKIGQELPEGEEEAFIKRDFDRARANHRLLFGYTGMHWRKADEPYIRDLHRRLDDYWHNNVWQG